VRRSFSFLRFIILFFCFSPPKLFLHHETHGLFLFYLFTCLYILFVCFVFCFSATVEERLNGGVGRYLMAPHVEEKLRFLDYLISYAEGLKIKIQLCRAVLEVRLDKKKCHRISVRRMSHVPCFRSRGLFALCSLFLRMLVLRSCYHKSALETGAKAMTRVAMTRVAMARVAMTRVAMTRVATASVEVCRTILCWQDSTRTDFPFFDTGNPLSFDKN
jgi:hypothetical protein